MKLTVVLGALYCSVASGVEFTVDQFLIDAPDIAPGNGACEVGLIAPTSGGQCTLRAAIMETNAIPGADTILIPIRDPAGIPTLEDLELDWSQPMCWICRAMVCLTIWRKKAILIFMMT